MKPLDIGTEIHRRIEQERQKQRREDVVATVILYTFIIGVIIAGLIANWT